MDYLDTKGRIFDVQKYSVHDGPGIRTIVFLKGCVLRCRWCCNPESQEYRIQNMKVLGEDKVIGRDVTVREMIEEVEKDRAYYYRSGGGITLSGGECMCQADFSRDLLRAAKGTRYQYSRRKYGLCPVGKDRAGSSVSGCISDGYQAHESGETQGIHRTRQRTDAGECKKGCPLWKN